MVQLHAQRIPGDVCPCTPYTKVMLDNILRTFLQNPDSLCGRFVKPGMTAMDIGCGPGFFTTALARMVGPEGRVHAVDLQEGMIELTRKKSHDQDLEDRIRFHQCRPDRIGISELADFILSFYMVHEVPDQDGFFSEVHGLLADGGRFLIVEPGFHVTTDAFEKTIESARKAGFIPLERPRVFFSRAVVLGKREE